MNVSSKQEKILDALQELLQNSDLQKISVNDIAEKAGIAKSSIYYYFSSKNEIIAALIERSYQKPLETAKQLAGQTQIPPFTRMAMISQACKNASVPLLAYESSHSIESVQELAYIHVKYLGYVISELKPALAEIINQAITAGDISFDYPEQLAEIMLIVLSMKIGNRIAPTTSEETEQTMRALVTLLEKGLETPPYAFHYLIPF